MDKHLAFILFGSSVCVACGLGLYFIIRSNERLDSIEKKKQKKYNP